MVLAYKVHGTPLNFNFRLTNIFSTLLSNVILGILCIKMYLNSSLHGRPAFVMVSSDKLICKLDGCKLGMTRHTVS